MKDNEARQVRLFIQKVPLRKVVRSVTFALHRHFHILIIFLSLFLKTISARAMILCTRSG